MMTIDRSGLTPQTYTLSNGQTLHLFPDTALEIVKIDVTFEAGPYYQSKKLVAVTTNKLLTEGTLHHSAQEIAEFLDARGIIVETSTNLFTASVSAYALRRYVTGLLPLLHEMLTEPAFSQQEFDICVAKRRQQLSTNLQKTSYVSHNLLYAALYGEEHPLGTWADMDDTYKVTPDDVRQFYREHYSLGQAQYIVSGHYDEEILRCFDDCFGHTAAMPLPTPPSVVDPVRQPSSLCSSLPNTVQSTLRIGRLLPLAWDSEAYARFLVLNTVLGGYFGSRLMANIREEKGYTYGIYSQTRLLRGSIVFSICTDVGAADARAALEEIYGEMQRLCDEPVPEEELEVVRNYLVGDFLRSIDGIFERSERFRQMTATGIDERFTDLSLHAMEHVTPQQLQDLARQTLRRELMTQVVVGPADTAAAS